MDILTKYIVTRYNFFHKIIPYNVEHLFFEYIFDYDLNVFPDELYNELKIVILNDCFNKSVDNIFPKSLTRLEFGYEFDQPINIQNLIFLKYLTFGKYFNQNVDKLPNSLLELNFGFRFNRNVDLLPKNIIKIKFGGSFSHKIDKLLNIIDMRFEHNVNIVRHNCIKHSVKNIETYMFSSIEINKNLPYGLKKITIININETWSNELRRSARMRGGGTRTCPIYIYKKIPYGCILGL